MKTLLQLLLVFILFTGCRNVIVLTEETLSDGIMYAEKSSVPFTGKCVVYYKNTKNLHYTFQYKKGILDGDFKSFFRNGKLEYAGEYSNGELSGKLVKYDESGNVNLTCQFKNQSQRSR